MQGVDSTLLYRPRNEVNWDTDILANSSTELNHIPIMVPRILALLKKKKKKKKREWNHGTEFNTAMFCFSIFLLVIENDSFVFLNSLKFSC